MHTFKDASGGEWKITLNVNAIRAVKAAGFDLGGSPLDLLGLLQGKGERLAELFNDPCTLVDLLAFLCSKQRDERKVSDLDFGELIGAGATLEAAGKALLEELIDFFPDRAKRAAWQKSIRAALELESKAVADLEAVTTEQLTEAMAKALRAPTSLTPSVTNAPASSAATPESGPSENC